MKPKLTVVPTDSDNSQPIDALDKRIVGNVTSALKFAFQIQPGREVVHILGKGTEKSNEEALETWVRQSLLKYGVAPTREGLTVLVSELEKHLSRTQAP